MIQLKNLTKSPAQHKNGYLNSDSSINNINFRIRFNFARRESDRMLPSMKLDSTQLLRVLKSKNLQRYQKRSHDLQDWNYLDLKDPVNMARINDFYWQSTIQGYRQGCNSVKNTRGIKTKEDRLFQTDEEIYNITTRLRKKYIQSIFLNPIYKNPPKLKQPTINDSQYFKCHLKQVSVIQRNLRQGLDMKQKWWNKSYKEDQHKKSYKKIEDILLKYSKNGIQSTELGQMLEGCFDSEMKLCKNRLFVMFLSKLLSDKNQARYNNISVMEVSRSYSLNKYNALYSGSEYKIMKQCLLRSLRLKQNDKDIDMKNKQNRKNKHMIWCQYLMRFLSQMQPNNFLIDQFKIKQINDMPICLQEFYQTGDLSSHTILEQNPEYSSNIFYRILANILQNKPLDSNQSEILLEQQREIIQLLKLKYISNHRKSPQFNTVKINTTKRLNESLDSNNINLAKQSLAQMTSYGLIQELCFDFFCREIYNIEVLPALVLLVEVFQSVELIEFSSRSIEQWADKFFFLLGSFIEQRKEQNTRQTFDITVHMISGVAKSIGKNKLQWGITRIFSKNSEMLRELMNTNFFFTFRFEWQVSFELLYACLAKSYCSQRQLIEYMKILFNNSNYFLFWKIRRNPQRQLKNLKVSQLQTRDTESTSGLGSSLSIKKDQTTNLSIENHLKNQSKITQTQNNKSTLTFSQTNKQLSYEASYRERTNFGELNHANIIINLAKESQLSQFKFRNQVFIMAMKVMGLWLVKMIDELGTKQKDRYYHLYIKIYLHVRQIVDEVFRVLCKYLNLDENMYIFNIHKSYVQYNDNYYRLEQLLRFKNAAFQILQVYDLFFNYMNISHNQSIISLMEFQDYLYTLIKDQQCKPTLFKICQNISKYQISDQTFGYQMLSRISEQVLKFLKDGMKYKRKINELRSRILHHLDYYLIFISECLQAISQKSDFKELNLSQKKQSFYDLERKYRFG